MNLEEEMGSSPKPSDKLQKRNKNLESMVSKLQGTIDYLNNLVKRLRDEELSQQYDSDQFMQYDIRSSEKGKASLKKEAEIPKEQSC